MTQTVNPHYYIGVRALCEFTAKRGDLDLRFTPSPNAREGIAGHQLVASRRGDDYETEIALHCTRALPPSDAMHTDTEVAHTLTVRGRADGYCPTDNRLEEIKTFRGDLNRLPANHRALHWAQLHCYGALFCNSRNIEEITLALVYFDVVRQTETLISESWHRTALNDILARHCDDFARWVVQEIAHRQTRNAALAQLAFPHSHFRTGQRALAEAVYKNLHQGRCLMAQAPTGIGKTLGTLFPALKTLTTCQRDKLFFLTAKTPGRQLALDALTTLADNADDAAGLPLRTLELVAREKSCVYPELACHGDSCPLAKGFYDRLPAARAAAAVAGRLDQSGLAAVAHAYEICPYYLGQEMARWSDVVVGDYNYYFDVGALLHGLTREHDWQVSLLVDEAHNLLPRARSMYTATLDEAQLARLARHAPKPLKNSFSRLEQAWQTVNLLPRGDTDLQGTGPQGADPQSAYRLFPEPPPVLMSALHNLVSAITDYRNDHPDDTRGALLDFYFDALHFCRIADAFDEHYLFDSSALTVEEMPAGDDLLQGLGDDGDRTRLCLRNLVPAPFITPRLKDAAGAVLFSATLSPAAFHADLLGMPEGTRWLDVEAPFSAEQLRVSLVPQSTRFNQRAASIAPIAALIARQFASQPGNYLAFFSSFDYLEAVADFLATHYPHVPLHRQSRSMPEAARQQFLARFTQDSAHVGFAVLGGAFAEGIDLPGARLIGSFIATLGLPQFNEINEQMRARVDALMPGKGYDYTYFYPGLQKVIQAAGRVIRTREDQGVVFLIDDRFSRPEVRTLLPAWWKLNWQ
ncbi:ATP-dependent DNA helicase [Alcanivorax sp. JB21]|uniref:ATP-dependent DNA helicase n=1 Tax=Alcanivorax limicola TaxID=2874102 RepID=UPI001CC0CAEE|nr:ATP-dependent DNA helicase [Alcanivorax limicola]MBZ2190129.1 ATP-dependent DNA helicase [Alcanivorax limicola]